jgi:hypothetical protein
MGRHRASEDVNIRSSAPYLVLLLTGRQIADTTPTRHDASQPQRGRT